MRKPIGQRQGSDMSLIEGRSRTLLFPLDSTNVYFLCSHVIEKSPVYKNLTNIYTSSLNVSRAATAQIQIQNINYINNISDITIPPMMCS